MCGIFGVFHFDRARPVPPALLIQGTDSLVHRGPNDGGAWLAPGVGLGQRRLSIIDLSAGGHQPMLDPTGRYALVFNGEIYNYRELRAELAAEGHRFRSDSDTEVLLHSLARWGEAALARLNGMFAFALYDRREHRLLLARDRLGKKPLYYYADAERLLFASELKAILADPAVPRDIDATAVADFFAFSYVPAPKTIYRRIAKLPAAHCLWVQGGALRPQEYWDVRFEEDAGGRSLEQHAERLHELLLDAVRLRLRSDVPLGAFLSGGVDSSATVALMAEALERPVLTCSIGFDVDRFDERAYARQIAERFRTQHAEQVLSPQAGQVVQQLSWFYDEPFGDSSAVPTYYLCEMTRRHVTVALSGDGGDELFAGYTHYRDALWAESLATRVPGLLLALAERPLRHLFQLSRYWPRAQSYNLLAWRMSLPFERSAYAGLLPQPFRYRELLSPDFVGALGGYDPFSQLEPHLARTAGLPSLTRLQYLDLKTYLPDDILVKVDRASMAHALEVRCPLLDHRVVEYSATIPPEFRFHRGRSKEVLKQAVARLIPPAFFERKKMGFAIPIAEWFRSALKERTAALLFDRPGGGSGLLSPAGARRLWLEHQRGLVNHGTPLWNALMFELWHERFIRRAAPPVTPTEPMRVHGPTSLLQDGGSA